MLLGTNQKLLILFLVIATIPALSSSTPTVHANLAPSNVPWTPAGPFENNLLFQVYSDQTAEFNALVNNQVDITDWPLPPSLVSSLSASPSVLITSPVSAFNYFDVEFNHANSYWGCAFNFGNAACGTNIRQGIAHLIDKTDFINIQLGGAGTAIDNPVPPALGLPTPSGECSWDPLYATCTNFTGAYHIASYGSSDGMAPTGSLDFCAAAQHFIAAGLAAGKDPTTCVLTGLSSSLSCSTCAITLFARIDDAPRYALGIALANAINRLTGITAVNVQGITITAAATIIFKTSGSLTGWWMYTGGFKDVTDFTNLYGLYNSIFAGNVCGGKATSAGSNYIFYCNPSYDYQTNLLEFNTTFTGAVTSGINAEDIYGKAVATIPIWSGIDRFGYLNGWTGVINAVGTGIPNPFTWLNAWNPSSSIPWTIRQGMKQGTDTLNIYQAQTAWDFFILSEVYDTLLVQNPMNPSQLMGWMAQGVQVLSPSQLGYPAPAGTLQTLRFNLRHDIYWQDGVPVTSSDVAFSILSFRDVPAANLQSSVLNVINVTMVNRFTADVQLNKPSPFSETNIGLLPIVPQHIWAVGGTGFVADPNKTSLTFDPVANYALIGSGPYACVSSTGRVGGGCTSSSIQSVGPGGTIVLQRFGLASTNHAFNSIYFRSSFNLKQWIWTDLNGDQNTDFADVAAAAYCYAKLVSVYPGCAHWDSPANGVGGNGDGVVELTEFAIVARYFLVQWTAPYMWIQLTTINSFPPTVYEGPTTYP